jgi:F-type H+-transporting ATPase subunit gamma
VTKVAQKTIDEFGKDNADLICIGKKGISFFKNRNYNIVTDYLDFWSGLNYQHAIDMGKNIITRFVDDEVDQVQVIYNKFINVGRQEVQNETFLPLAYEPSEDATPVASDRIFEPSKDDVVKALVPRYLNTKVWQYLLESFAAEQAARMVAMENATTNAQDMIKDLKLQFNKARQTAITTEMLEIVSGAEALS